ncbi:MAG: RagB/SusD family nutrient uptake outer membrane protein [Bacteroidia bacterium]|nr:RagB/SusD family nutrient uptake outer membrane protein [Bacteroidia bacterium]
MKSLFHKVCTIGVLAGGMFVASSCIGALDRVPFIEVTSATVYADANNYKLILAKLYAGLAVSGQQGPAGRPDISGIDEGFSTYLRQYWKAQELPTDEAVIGWNDGSLPDYHDMDWTSSNEFITAMYNRIYYQIGLCNEYIRETTDEKLAERGFDAAVVENIKLYRAEARFLRALSYWHALDMFGNVPFVTELDAVGSFLPERTTRGELFAYIESELKAIEAELAAPRSNEYGRADKAAAWMLLAKLYLNAEVYTGQAKYTEAVTECKKVIDAGFTLDAEYRTLFLTDNDQSDEIIFPVTFDGNRTKTWGGMTFLVHAPVGGSMNPAEFGINGGWSGLRTTKNLVNKFPAVGGGTQLVSPNEGNTANYTKIYVPGAHQGWDPATAPTLTSAAGDRTFEGYLWFEAGTEFKFTDGPAWDVNYGDNGADGTLEPGGANLKVTDAGFYKLNVNLNDLLVTVEKTSWGLIGSATADQWNSDQDMTYDAAEQAWVITAPLTVGEIKFRSNDAWSLNYGDGGADGILERDGANIAIPNAGTYLIKLYLDKPDYTYSIEIPSFDTRAMFYTQGQNLEIADIFAFTDGYAITKYRNVSSTGVVGSDSEGNFPDTDFPMFRLGDVYLMYAEAVLRGGAGGSLADALGYVNQLRRRAYGDNSGDLTELTLDIVLDERSRELYWEAHRRTDLIRFGKFTSDSYLWPWKGGIAPGRGVEAFRSLFPIPASDLVANPNLQQNPGY